MGSFDGDDEPLGFITSGSLLEQLTEQQLLHKQGHGVSSICGNNLWED
jgi:hypothetical protein